MSSVAEICCSNQSNKLSVGNTLPTYVTLSHSTHSYIACSLQSADDKLVAVSCLQPANHLRLHSPPAQSAQQLFSQGYRQTPRQTLTPYHNPATKPPLRLPCDKTPSSVLGLCRVAGVSLR